MPVLIDAYAKINLSLDIIGKREDGYHLLSMVMQSVSLHDTLLLCRRPEGGIRLRCNRPELPCDAHNTVYRAAESFFAAAGIRNGNVLIQMRKRIPSQAGLGGGSSDAAAALVALNHIYGAGLTADQLCELGVSVGADVPFCVRGGTALAQGIGEKLTSLRPMPHCWIVICKPQIGIDTAQAYAMSDQTEKTAFYTPFLANAVQSGSLEKIASSIGNEFEQVLDLPEISLIKHQMIALGALGACMTGSGSAVFSIFDNLESAQLCTKELSRMYRDVFLCEPVEEMEE